MSASPLTIHIDGASRGNPGPAAFAFVISGAGPAPLEVSGCMGRATNNVAEYTALVKALQRAAELKAHHLLIRSDSELLVKQMRGEYRVKNADLQTLYEEARALVKQFDKVEFTHVRREHNAEADRLCNEALDGAARPAAAPKKATAKKTSQPRTAAARAEALDCLRAAAAAWAQGGGPNVEMVWDQLWSILEEHHIVRTAPPG